MKYVAIRYGVTFGKCDSSDWIDYEASRNLLDTFETGHVTIGHIVCDHNLIAGLNKFDCHMTADISGSA